VTEERSKAAQLAFGLVYGRSEKVELCSCYTTTGYPRFVPVCLRNHRASLRCHSKNCCLDYRIECEHWLDCQFGNYKCIKEASGKSS